MKIGIVGAENSHCAAIASLLNQERLCGAERVVAVWGETRALARKAAVDGNIPEIVRRPTDMIGKIDGVMIDHRHGRYHIPAAIPFIEAGIPTFIDKPLACNMKEARKLLQLARRKRVPITSFSILPEQASFQKDLMRQIRRAGKLVSIHSIGPCDVTSKYGGVFFYGVHQIEGILKGFGPGIEAVRLFKPSRGSQDAAAVMFYRNGGPIVHVSFVAGMQPPFSFKAVGRNGPVEYTQQRDTKPHLSGARKFLTMFRTRKEPFTAAQMLETIAVLEALDKSLKTGKMVRVEKV